MGTINLKAMSNIVKFPCEELEVTTKDIFRYAGGSRFRPNTQKMNLAADMLTFALTLIQPAFVYAEHHIKKIDPKKGVFFEGDVFLPLPPNTLDANAVKFVSCACSLGSELEKKTTLLMAQGKSLDALFLNAAGIALLESISDKAQLHLEKKAEKKGLFTSCRFGPGYGDIPIEAQKILFETVNSETIGVYLKPAGVLSPLMSLSFWILWTTRRFFENNTNKCENCTQKNCDYRIKDPLK